MAAGASFSRPAPGHEIYPCLLRGVDIIRAHQIPSTDIPCIPIRGRFLDLAAVLDWRRSR